MLRAWVGETPRLMPTHTCVTSKRQGTCARLQRGSQDVDWATNGVVVADLGRDVGAHKKFPWHLFFVLCAHP
jgi:hypothetical protein